MMSLELEKTMQTILIWKMYFSFHYFNHILIENFKKLRKSENLLAHFQDYTSSTKNAKPRGNYNPHSHLKTRGSKIKHFKKPRFPCFEHQK